MSELCQISAPIQAELLDLSFQHSPFAQVVCDANNAIIAINDEFTRLTQYTIEEVKGKNPRVLSAGLTAPEVYVEMWHRLTTENTWQGELLDRRKDGMTYNKLLHINRIVKNGEIYFLGAFIDLSRCSAPTSDPLTGLYTRASLETVLRQGLAMAARNNTKVALLLLDLDGFKKINDSYGHPVGDHLLRELAARFRLDVRETDCISRLGGDEFAFVMEPQAFANDGLIKVAKRLLKSAFTPVLHDGQPLQVSASIGVAIFPEDASSADELFKCADEALYEAKALGKNQFHYYSEKLKQRTKDKKLLEKILIDNLRDPSAPELFLTYQPKFALPSREPIGMEALLRMHDDLHGVVSPGVFLPLIEDNTSLMMHLSTWLIRQVVSDLAAWRDRGRKLLPVSINISAKQLTTRLPERIAQYCRDHGLPTSLIIIELTETSALRDPELGVKVLSALRAIGVKVHIDDFGTGYSSLGYLSRLPVDGLKIDRSFVNDMDSDPTAEAIVATTISLARRLNLSVVAEGVETETQLNTLVSHGCEAMQGFLLSRPISAPEIEELLPLAA